MSTMTEWAEAPENPGYRVKVIQHGNCTIRILRPILDKTERTKRENYVKAVAESTLRDYYKRKELERQCL